MHGITTHGPPRVCHHHMYIVVRILLGEEMVSDQSFVCEQQPQA